MAYKVQILVKGNRARWLDCQTNRDDKTETRTFATIGEADDFGQRFPEKHRVVAL